MLSFLSRFLAISNLRVTFKLRSTQLTSYFRRIQLNRRLNQQRYYKLGKEFNVFTMDGSPSLTLPNLT